jgi:hypothetical protein
MNYRWIIGRRKAERRETRELVEQVAAGIAGRPPNLPLLASSTMLLDRTADTVCALNYPASNPSISSAYLRPLVHGNSLCAMRATGVGQPPAAAAGASAAAPAMSEDEEGMDEPPEVREFMQELGEGNATAGSAAATGGVPDGPLGVLICAALGTVSLSARYVEWTCNSADWLLSRTPPGVVLPPCKVAYVPNVDMP